MVWRFWVWLAFVGATGFALGLLAMFLLQGRADASKFGQSPRVFCSSAGGSIVDTVDGGRFCGIWIDMPPRQE